MDHDIVSRVQNSLSLTANKLFIILGEEEEFDAGMPGWDDINQAEMQQLVEEVQDFAEDVNEMNVSLEIAAKRLRTSADYLDQVWKDCRKGYAVGSSVGITGGVLTVLGGVATIMTAGAAAPALLTVGTAFGVAGACANLGTVGVEACANSAVIKETNREVQKAYRAMDKVNKRVNKLRNGKSRLKLLCLAYLAKKILGENHPVVAFIKDLLPTSSLANVIPKAVDALRTLFGIKRATTAPSREAIENTLIVAGKEVGTEVGARATGKAGSEAASKAAGNAVTKEGSKTVSKAGAQGGAKAAGKVIIGVSVVFLVWDVVDLAYTVNDIVKNKGSDAARCLREKADEYETILRKLSNFNKKKTCSGGLTWQVNAEI